MYSLNWFSSYDVTNRQTCTCNAVELLSLSKKRFTSDINTQIIVKNFYLYSVWFDFSKIMENEESSDVTKKK